MTVTTTTPCILLVAGAAATVPKVEMLFSGFTLATTTKDIIHIGMGAGAAATVEPEETQDMAGAGGVVMGHPAREETGESHKPTIQGSQAALPLGVGAMVDKEETEFALLAIWDTGNLAVAEILDDAYTTAPRPSNT